MENLLTQGAISQQQRDQARAAADSAIARRNELAAALQRAEEGTPREELEQAREEHAQAQAALDLLLAGSRPEEKAAARAQVAAAHQNLRLLQRGTRAEDLQAARAKLAQAKASLDALRAGSRKEEIRQARAAAEAAAASARAATNTLQERVLRAPRDGTIERILVAVGDLVSPATPVVRMADPSDIWIRVYVPEALLAKVAIGSDASVRVDGIATPLPAFVESIATRGEFTPANLQTPEERGKQVFAVRLRLRPPDPRVKAGMYATVTRIGNWP
jgi:HlyD family secretion protein